MYSLMIGGRNLLLFKKEIIYGRKPTMELRKKCCNFRVSVKLVQNSSVPNSFSSASVAVDVSHGRKGKSFTASYLVSSLGLSTQLAESISRKVSFEDKGNLDSVLSLLRSYGFTESQICSIITGYPRLLVLDAEKSLGPKLQFLRSKGASSSELSDILSKVPKILGLKEENTISNYYDLVKEIIEADKSPKYEKSCHYLPEGIRQKNKFRNILVLRELGLPPKSLFSLLFSDFSSVCGNERFEESLKKVVEIGFNPTSSRFVNALNVVQRLSDKALEEKVNAYKRLGFAEEDVWEMFKMFPPLLGISEKKRLNSFETYLGLGFSRDEFVIMVKRFPHCIGYSPKSVKKKTEFLLKKMNWPKKAVVLNPAVVGLSMEKRIVPRCNVIIALLSKRLIKSEFPPLSSVLLCNDERFLKRYVRKHDDDKELVAKLMTIFTGKKN